MGLENPVQYQFLLLQTTRFPVHSVPVSSAGQEGYQHSGTGVSPGSAQCPHGSPQSDVVRPWASTIWIGSCREGFQHPGWYQPRARGQVWAQQHADPAQLCGAVFRWCSSCSDFSCRKMFKAATWNFQQILTLEVLITAAPTAEVASNKGYRLSIIIPVG